MHEENNGLASLFPPTILSEQIVENDAVARREDTLEVHSSSFRKLKFDKEAAVERWCDGFAEILCVAETNIEMLGRCTCVEKPDIKRSMSGPFAQ